MMDPTTVIPATKKRRSMRLARSNDHEPTVASQSQKLQEGPLSQDAVHARQALLPTTAFDNQALVSNARSISTSGLELNSRFCNSLAGANSTGNKENIMAYHQLADRVKQNKRSATKMYGSGIEANVATLSTHRTHPGVSDKAAANVRNHLTFDITCSSPPGKKSSNHTYSGNLPVGHNLSRNTVATTSLPKRNIDDPQYDPKPLSRKRSCPIATPQDRFEDTDKVSSPYTLPVELEVQQQEPTSASTDMSFNTPEAASRAEQDERLIERIRVSLHTQSKRKEKNVGKRQARRISALLDIAKPPDSSEALFLSGDEAKKHLEPGVYFPGPIITKGQQPLELQSVEAFLKEMYNKNLKVSVQDPGSEDSKDVSPVREVTIEQLRHQFSRPRSSTPWNCLELATHVEDGLRPAFLNGEDCRLLTKVKHPSSEESASRRGYPPGWKEVEKWALLAQAGALTEPHQDSHGYSTYITVNEGNIGFGWLANPSAQERAAWPNEPHTFTGGNWRRVILRPGDTVFFPAGTVHFVFRLPSGSNTLAFGGHVLRCSQIVRWAKTLLEELGNRAVTNEDISESAPAYLDKVDEFVRQAMRDDGDKNLWGGEEAMKEFLRLKREFTWKAEGK